MTEFEIRSTSTDDLGDAHPLAELRTSLFRAAMLFGVVAIAFVMVVMPQVEHIGGQYHASGPQLDMMTTGSIRGSGEGGSRIFQVQRSIPQSLDGACMAYQGNLRTGAC